MLLRFVPCALLNEGPLLLVQGELLISILVPLSHWVSFALCAPGVREGEKALDFFVFIVFGVGRKDGSRGLCPPFTLQIWGGLIGMDFYSPHPCLMCARFQHISPRLAGPLSGLAVWSGYNKLASLSLPVPCL